MSFLLGTTAGALVAGGVRAMDWKHTLAQTALPLGVLWLLQSRPLANGAAPGRVCIAHISYCFRALTHNLQYEGPLRPP
jgi:hypothetical protein